MSWDYTRSIPWSKIYQNAPDPEGHRESIMREMQKEASLSAESSLNDDQPLEDVAKSTGVPFSTAELFKQAAFGGCIGTITGAVFGFMDGMRTAGESSLLQKASDTAKGRYLFQSTTRSATVFGVFFGGFHVAKYGLRVAADPGEWVEIGVAGAASMGVLMSRPSFRPSMPYAGMLIIMDGVHIIMREFDKK